MSDIRKALVPFLAFGMAMESEITPMTSNESMEWYNALDQEKQDYLKDEGFEDLTGQSYESMGLLLSHEERVKVAYDKLKIEGFDI